MQKEINSKCRTLAYISLVLTVLGLAIFAILHYRKSKLCKGHMLSNAAKFMIIISDVQNYIPIKLCKTAGSIHLFKIAGTLKAENINAYGGFSFCLTSYIINFLKKRPKYCSWRQAFTWYIPRFFQVQRKC